ncbi:hydatid disease diagnostic antigen P-29-like [Symsagittifera roscoffensis]|uniref:hydatid disease diagnostic antigen P-29-like n=1 Tax=Symsagittifera roscoffensis TaxID=84072 RepID=UPI00307C0A56
MTTSDMTLPNKIPSALTRSYQKISEHFSSSQEKTEFSQSILRVFHELDSLHEWCNKIIEQMQAIVEPNPAYRMSSTFKKFVAKDTDDKNVPKSEETNLGLLLDQGVSLVAPSGTNSVAEMQNFASLERALGHARERFSHAIKYEIIVGLQTVALQLAQLKGVKKELENRRLDVDYYKGRLRASSTAVAIESANNSLDEATDALTVAMEDFERQAKSKLPVMQAEISNMTHEFMKLQQKYFTESQTALTKMEENNNSRDDIAESRSGKTNGVNKIEEESAVASTSSFSI